MASRQRRHTPNILTIHNKTLMRACDAVTCTTAAAQGRSFYRFSVEIGSLEMCHPPGKNIGQFQWQEQSRGRDGSEKLLVLK